MHQSSLRPRRLATALALLALAVSALAPASLGAAKKSHKVSTTVTAATVQTSGNVAVVAGVVTGKPFRGRGAVVYRITGTPPTQTATFTAFDKRGSVSGDSTATVAAGPNNTLTVNGTGKITSGTGSYKGATGKVTITGAIDSNGVIHFTGTGSVKY